MLRIGFFILFAAFSITSYSAVCEFEFLRKYYKTTYKNQRAQLNKVTKKFSLLKDSFRNLSDEDQLKTITDLHRSISRSFETRHARYRSILESKPSDPLIQEKYNTRVVNLFREHKEASDLLVSFTKIMTDKRQIQTQLRQYEFAPNEYYQYLEFLNASNIPNRGLKLLNAYRNKFQVDALTYDPLTNIKFRAAGFFDPKTNRVEIGFDGLKGLLHNEVVSIVAKHEFFHAVFFYWRKTGHIINTKWLPKNFIIFLHSGRWGSEVLLSPQNFSKSVIRRKLDSILFYTSYSQDIIEQTGFAAKNFVSFLKSLRGSKTPPKGFRFIQFLDSDRLPTNNINDAVFYAITNPKTNHQLIDFLSPELMPLAEKVLNNRLGLLKDYNRKFNLLGNQNRTNNLRQLDADFANRDFLLNKEMQLSLIDSLLKKQQTLVTLSQLVGPENQQILKKIQEQISR